MDPAEGSTGDPALATFWFHADGTNPVMIDFATTGTQIVPLNGFSLVYVPEPTTLTLLGFGAAGLLIRRRRK